MSRRGVTLIELLIALAITMIMMGAVVTLFANMTTSVTDSRAVIEMSERLRAARNTLQNDLAGHTAPTIPPLDPGADLGFLELIEGMTYFDCGSTSIVGASLMLSPYKVTAGVTSGNSIVGDIDDIIHLTVRSTGKPFIGRMGFNGGNPLMMESQTAEVIWFALPNGRRLTNSDGTTTQLCTLYRRVLLVLPGYNLQGAGAGTVPALYANYDISARNDLVTGQTVANTLGDLTKRENRFYHGTPGSNPPGNFPFQLNNSPAYIAANMILTGPRLGEDVVLDNVLAFDVRVFDPLTPTYKAPDGTILVPSDVGYLNAGTLAKVASNGGSLGCFVDMGYAQVQRPAPFTWNFPSYFFTSLTNSSYSHMPFSAASFPCATYCTWSTSYEQNGYDEDGIGGIDQGTNGLDDPGMLGGLNGVVDDPPSFNPTSAAAFPGERETMAPFPNPLRAMQVILRVYEPDSRQVRQVTVVQDFIPE